MAFFGPGDQPFLTEDSILAYGLYLAFAHFCDDDVPCVNYYTPAELRSMGYKGMLPGEAAMKAVQEGRKGHVTYVFSPPVNELRAIYNDQKKFIDEGNGLARDVIRNLFNDYRNNARSYEETVMRVLCTIVYMRAEFVVLWRKLVPMIRFDDSGLVTSENGLDGSRILTYGGFKFVSANAGKAVRDHLQL